MIKVLPEEVGTDCQLMQIAAMMRQIFTVIEKKFLFQTLITIKCPLFSKWDFYLPGNVWGGSIYKLFIFKIKTLSEPRENL